jgi:hypothetical protein
MDSHDTLYQIVAKPPNLKIFHSHLCSIGMDLNTFGLLFLGSLGLYGTYHYRKEDIAALPKTLKTPWGEQVGKTRPIQSKTGDASMATEARRRRTIQGASCEELYKLKESRTTTGSATGAIETYFLTSVCPARPKKSVVPVVPPFIPVSSYTFTAAGLDTNVWGPYTTGLVDVVSATSSFYVSFFEEEPDVFAPQQGNYMARLKASSPVTPTVLVLPFYAPGRSVVTFVIRFLSFEQDAWFNDFATVLDVVQEPSPSTTTLFTIRSSDLSFSTESDWLEIRREIPNGGNHNLTFAVQNVFDDNLDNSSELLVYSVLIERDSV